jgi:hypothetical protein
MNNRGSYLTTNQYLRNLDYLLSDNGQYAALLQDDGNFALYHYNSSGTNYFTTFISPYWATHIDGLDRVFAIMQTDGNFVLYKGTDPSNNLGYIWSISHTALPTGPYFAIMQDDGNFVVYHGTGPSNNLGVVWATGVNAKLTIAYGNNQRQPRVSTPSGTATATFGPLAVRLTDNTGNPLSSKQVTWSVWRLPGPDMKVYFTNVGSSSGTSITDANGIAFLAQQDGSSVRAYGADGAFTIAAISGSALVTFNLTVGSPVSALSVTILAGNNQTVARTGSAVPGGIATFAPLQVKVLDPNGTPASGVEVAFACTFIPQGMVVQIDGLAGLGAALVVTTDANGIATLSSMSASYASGGITVGANLPVTGGGVVYFHEYVSS